MLYKWKWYYISKNSNILYRKRLKKNRSNVVCSPTNKKIFTKRNRKIFYKRFIVVKGRMIVLWTYMDKGLFEQEWQPIVLNSVDYMIQLLPYLLYFSCPNWNEKKDEYKIVQIPNIFPYPTPKGFVFMIHSFSIVHRTWISIIKNKIKHFKEEDL